MEKLRNSEIYENIGLSLIKQEHVERKQGMPQSSQPVTDMYERSEVCNVVETDTDTKIDFALKAEGCVDIHKQPFFTDIGQSKKASDMKMTHNGEHYQNVDSTTIKQENLEIKQEPREINQFHTDMFEVPIEICDIVEANINTNIGLALKAKGKGKIDSSTIKQEHLEIKQEPQQTIQLHTHMYEVPIETCDIVEADMDTNIGLALKAEGKGRIDSSIIKQEHVETHEIDAVSVFCQPDFTGAFQEEAYISLQSASCGRTRASTSDDVSQLHLETRTQEKEERGTSEGLFHCPHCSYKSIKKYRLKNHMKRHTGEGLFYCNHCIYKTVWKNHLYIHMKKHTGVGLFYCSHCTYNTAKKGNLNVHMKKHTGKGLFQCPHCPYKSIRKDHLNTHTKRHTGEGLFHCQYCTYKSVWKNHLNSHMKKHTGEGYFQCSHCTYKSNRKDHLKTHMKKHTGEGLFHCDYCTYKSVWRNHVDVHMKTHTGEGLFQCGHCTYQTSRKDHFNTHVKKHTGEGLFHCPHCAYTSAWRNHVNVHMKKHVGEVITPLTTTDVKLLVT